MSDIAVVACAVAAWSGALVALPAPRWLGLVTVAAGLVGRRSAVVVAGVALLAGALATASWAGLRPPDPARVAGEAVLVRDPVSAGHSLRVDLRLGSRRVEAWARGTAADGLRDRLAGEVVAVAGRLRPAPEDARARLAVRHVAARLTVDHAHRVGAGSVAARAANGYRRLLARGAVSLPDDRRALLHGFLLGDDRDIPVPVAADFRSSGLTHLLAVSGQNVAFLLAVAGPALRRLGLRGRLVASVTLIGFFAVATRAEPSVLRASVMAALACWAAFAGRPASRLRLVGLAVTALVLVDPMLARNVGFQLSVGATVGLLLLARPIADRLPGPRWLAEPLAVTLGAQVGVAPVLVTTFGGMPVVTVLANLLAVPVAGPLTAWGMTAGLVAGLTEGPVATLLHRPTDLMVAWVAGVARWSAGLPLGAVGLRETVSIAVLLGAALALRRRLAVLLAVAAVLVLARPATGAVEARELARGAVLWRDGRSVLVLDGATDPARVLDGLHRAGVRSLDLVVARRGTRTIGGVLVGIRSRVPVRAVAAPAGHRIRDATAVTEPVDLRVGRLVIRLRPAGAALDVDIGETAGDAGAAR